MATSMTEKRELNNITLTNSERQKRLLPYVNFYQNQNFNKHDNQIYEKYQQPPRKVYNQYDYQNPDINYESKFTPFRTNNAVPGQFKPMVSTPSPQRIKVQYVPLPHNKVPNFSELYENLAQLKLAQNYRRPSYVEIKHPIPQKAYIPKPQVYNRHQLIQPTKTTIETYTATNIDIPTGPADNQYQYYSENKPYINHQIAVEVPYSSFPEQNYNKQQEVRKPFIIVSAGPQEHANKPIILVRRPIKNKNPVSYEVPKYVEVSNQYENNYQPVTTKYEDEPYEEFPRYAEYIETPKYEESPKYIESAKYVEAPKYEDVPKYVEVPKYAEAPKYVVTQKYEEIPKYQSTPSDLDYQLHPPKHINLALILKHLQSTNTLPKTLTTDNIDNSIKTLVKILNVLKTQRKLPKPILVQEQGPQNYIEDIQNVGISGHPNEVSLDGNEVYPEDTEEGGTPGKAGVDYPALSSIPQTSFNCKTQRYKGFFGDPDTHCQVWHYCDLNGGQASFLCPNGTIFSQVALTCDWWYNVKCSSTAQLYVLNERLYKYIIPLSPKFPEDYTGPLVDKYLALKFQEMEEKMRKEKKGKGNSSKEDESMEEEDAEADNTEKVSRVETSTKVSKINQKETLDTVEEDNEN